MKRQVVSCREWSWVTIGDQEQVRRFSSNRETIFVSRQDFDWLATLAKDDDRSPVMMTGYRSLCFKGWVGVLESPNGTIFEILPKTIFRTSTNIESETPEIELSRSRSLLIRLIESTWRTVPEVSTVTELMQRRQLPLQEWLVSGFLCELQRLFAIGLRSDYETIESEEKYLQGRLLLHKQLKKPIGRDLIFSVRNSIFSINRAENRLIRLALEKIFYKYKSFKYKSIIVHALEAMYEIPTSLDQRRDFQCWLDTRLLSDYKRIRPFVELILNQNLPYSIIGYTKGLSFLYPMETLFEESVFRALSFAKSVEKLPFRILEQVKSVGLWQQGDRNRLVMKPDFILESKGTVVAIADAKWKWFDPTVGPAREDLYQLFAYGKKILPNGSGDLFLFYPKTKRFQKEDSPLVSDGLKLRILPVDLLTNNVDRIEGQLLLNG